MINEYFNLHKFIDLTGKKFGRLTVIKRVYPNNKCRNSMWLCKCDCGGEKIIIGHHLRQGHTRSCGCLQKEITRNRMKIKFGLAKMRYVIENYKQGAKRREFKWDLTEEQFKEITQRDCHYCGAKPNNISKNKCNTGDYIYNGIDRINNNKGYTMDNIVPCCKICNRAKGNLSLQEFQGWIERLIMYYKEKKC